MKYILWWNLVKKPPRIESCNNRISTSFEVPISKISRRCLSHQIASYFGRKTTARISPKLGNFSYFIQPPQDPYSPCSPLFRPLCSSPPSPPLLSRPVPRSEALVRGQRRRLTSSTSFLLRTGKSHGWLQEQPGKPASLQDGSEPYLAMPKPVFRTWAYRRSTALFRC